MILISKDRSPDEPSGRALRAARGRHPGTVFPQSPRWCGHPAVPSEISAMPKPDIDQIKLRRLDFSMLLIFRDLVRLQKTTVVAAQLGLSQSAISHALSRLRDLFNDPWFIRRPNGLEPTLRAMELLPKIETILRVTQDALAMPSQFDPAASTRSFRPGG